MKSLVRCLACGSKNLKKLIDLGEQSLANDYRAIGELYHEKYPLVLNRCLDCNHAQQKVSVDPTVLYDNYLYVSGTSNTLREYFASFAKEVTERYGVGSILDIACNDGTMLNEFKKLGWKVMGVDPARNLKEYTDKLDIPVMVDYWNESLAEKFSQYDIVTAFNVVAHGPDPLSLLKGMKKVAKKAIYIMTSQSEMFQRGEFDTIYHEHHSFFCVNSMLELVKRAGINWMMSVRKEPVHGNAYLFELNNPFPEYVNLTNHLRYDLGQLKSPLVAYGAAAKGVVMLNSSEARPEYVIDENPLKYNKTIPGTSIPIYSPEKLIEDPRDLYIIILAWNFFDEIKEKIKQLRPEKKDIIINPYDL